MKGEKREEGKQEGRMRGMKKRRGSETTGKEGGREMREKIGGGKGKKIGKEKERKRRGGSETQGKERGTERRVRRWMRKRGEQARGKEE